MVRTLKLNVFSRYQTLTLDLILELLEDAYKREEELDRYLSSLSDKVFQQVKKELQQLEKDGKIDLSQKVRLRDHPGLYKVVRDIENREWQRFTDYLWIGMQVIKESMLDTYKTTLDKTYQMFQSEWERPGLHPPTLPLDWTFADGRVSSHNPQMRDQFITDNILNIPWCQDGKIYSERLYGHVRQFQLKLEWVLEEGISNGKGYDWMLETWQKLTGSTAYDAARLLKTETMAMWSLATKEAYLSMGIEMVEIVNPEPCNEVCSDYVGEVIPLAQAELGDELPPYHPNCMCEYFAYYEETDGQNEFNIIE